MRASSTSSQQGKLARRATVSSFAFSPVDLEYDDSGEYLDVVYRNVVEMQGMEAVAALAARPKGSPEWLEGAEVDSKSISGQNYIQMIEQMRVIDQAYPKITLDLIFVEGCVFGPDAIGALSRVCNVPTNRMFIACPGMCVVCKGTTRVCILYAVICVTMVDCLFMQM
jgi:hypothetical protein